MRRLLLVATLLATAAASTASAAPMRVRKMVKPYVTPGGVAGVIAGTGNLNGTEVGGATFRIRPTDRAIALTLVDDSGQPVAAEIRLDRDGDGSNDESYGPFCGKLPATAIPGGTELVVSLQLGTCGAAGASAPTKGTVTLEVTGR